MSGIDWRGMCRREVYRTKWGEWIDMGTLTHTGHLMLCPKFLELALNIRESLRVWIYNDLP